MVEGGCGATGIPRAAFGYPTPTPRRDIGKRHRFQPGAAELPLSRPGWSGVGLFSPLMPGSICPWWYPEPWDAG